MKSSGRWDINKKLIAYMILVGAITILIMDCAALSIANSRLQTKILAVESAANKKSDENALKYKDTDQICAAWLMNANMLEARTRICTSVVNKSISKGK